jgi:hypothetical protein
MVQVLVVEQAKLKEDNAKLTAKVASLEKNVCASMREEYAMVCPMYYLTGRYNPVGCVAGLCPRTIEYHCAADTACDSVLCCCLPSLLAEIVYQPLAWVIHCCPGCPTK